MKVLYIVGQSEGGLPHYSAELANNVATHADVTVMKPSTTDGDELFDDEVQLIDAFEPLGVSMSKIYNSSVDPRDVYHGLVSYTNVQQISDLNVDIVHDPTGLFPQVKVFVRYHGIDTDHPFVVTRHEVPMNRFSPSRPPVMVEEAIKAILPEINEDLSIVHTDHQRDALIAQGRMPAEQVSVIPHGAYSVFGDRDDLSTDPEPNTILFFGNVVPPKGIDTIIRAIPQIKSEIPDVKLLIAGDGRIPNEVQSIIDSHPENFDIHNYFIPNKDVIDFFARAELVVLPYRSQNGSKGHSGALSTAFSFGKPVVASTAGDFRNLVAETGAGTVVPPENPTALADAISTVLTDEEVKAQMSTQSHQMADQLSWERIAEKHVELYERLLSDSTVTVPTQFRSIN